MILNKTCNTNLYNGKKLHYCVKRLFCILNLYNQGKNFIIFLFKAIISSWREFTKRNIDVLLTYLRIAHSRTMQRYFMFGEPTSMCPQCDLSYWTIHHTLTDYPSFQHLYGYYFKFSILDQSNLIGKTPYDSLLDFLKSSGIWHNIWCHPFKHISTISKLWNVFIFLFIFNDLDVYCPTTLSVEYWHAAKKDDSKWSYLIGRRN